MTFQKHGCGALILPERCLNRDAGYSWLAQLPERGILLLQRGWKAPTFPGFWGGPGGLKNQGEEPTRAAARECYEEIGIDFRPDQEPFFEGEWNDRHLSYYLGDWMAPEYLAVQPEEAAGYGWFTFEGALALPTSFLYKDAIERLTAR